MGGSWKIGVGVIGVESSLPHFNPKYALATGRSGERGVKMVRNVTRLQGGSGNP
jgi:hypothetical protein